MDECAFGYDGSTNSKSTFPVFMTVGTKVTATHDRNTFCHNDKPCHAGTDNWGWYIQLQIDKGF
jgi:hypothetical protein